MSSGEESWVPLSPPQWGNMQTNYPVGFGPLITTKCVKAKLLN